MQEDPGQENPRTHLYRFPIASKTSMTDTVLRARQVSPNVFSCRYCEYPCMYVPIYPESRR